MERPPDEKTILKAIQPYLDQQEKERDIQGEIESYGHRLRLVSFLRDTLTEFFEQDLKDIVTVEPIWKWLQTKLKDEIDWILSDKEEFLEGRDWSLQQSIDDALKDLENTLDVLLQKEQRELWQLADLEQAVRTMKIWGEKGIFVALLDKEGKLLEEPYPVTMDPTIKVKVELEEDSIHKGRINVVARTDKPIHGNVKAVVLCEAPEDLDKTEVIVLEGGE